jgi:hypothetical protein
MKRVYLFLIVSLLTSVLLAQEPVWLDPVSRANNWPEEQFLIAFGTEVLGKDQSESEAQSKLYEIVKSQISDAILVSINAQTSLNITVENAATDEKLERKSASSSEVELVGLKLDSYFNKRKKSLYAFGYVSIKELSDYHRKNIMDKSTQVDQNLKQAASSSNKSEKIKLYVANKLLLDDIQKSARLLTALSEPHGADITSLQRTATQNEELLDGLFRTGQITLDHLVVRISGELLNALPKGSNISVTSQSISYASSEVKSAFSEALQKQLSTSVGESSKVTISGGSTGSLSGTFVQNESETVFNITLTDQDAVVAATEVAVTTSVIDTKGLQLLPPNFSYIPNLSSVAIVGPKSFTIKPSEYTSKPIVLTYSLNSSPVPNLSVLISIDNEGKSKKYAATSDADGKVTFNLDESMVTPGTEYLLNAEIDLEKFLSIENGNEFLKYIRNNQRIPSHDLALTVNSPTVFISSSEVGINGPLSVKVLEPAVKSGLAELRYAFTEDQSTADFELTIEAQARKGQAGDIATLTFVDATIALVNRVNGKEIYKNSFFNIKGIGANFDVAQSSAFQKTRNEMVDDITYELEYNR